MTERAKTVELRAAHESTGGFGEWGSADQHRRYLVPAPNRRRKCRCGCGGHTTHIGKANGVALTSGCEMHVRRWVRQEGA